MKAIPSVLETVPIRCFYCENVVVNVDYPDPCDTTIGIRYCVAHQALADRDVKAFLHLDKRVRLSDAITHPVLKLFLNSTGPNIYRIGNGGPPDYAQPFGGYAVRWETEVGKESIYYSNHLQTDCKWYLPLIKDGCKGAMRIVDFLDARLIPLNSTILPTLVVPVLDLLEKGFYKEAYEAHCLAE